MASVMESSTLREAVGKVPVRVGRYDVVGLIGHGGMGDVYEAIDTELGGRVALKTLRVREIAPERLLLFKNEFRAVADLTHRNLVPLYELACHEGLWFFTMELIEGVNLVDGIRRTISEASVSRSREIAPPTEATRADRPTTRPDAETLQAPALPALATPVCDLEFFDDTMAQILDALEYLHQRGVIHQDLKPSNILVEPNGTVRILDFGLVQRVGRPSRLNEEAAVIGTPPYMAPELWVGASATPESDLFALGCVMFQLLAGQLPVAERWVNVRRVPRLADVVEGVPAAIMEICQRLLARDPRERPSIAEVREALGIEHRAAPEDPSARRLVGRAREQALLRDAWARVAQGGSVVTLVQGGSGVGKSALVHSSFRSGGDVPGSLVLHGRCYERESVPYKAFDGMIDALAVKLAAYDDEQLAQLLPPWFGELTQVFPVLSRGELVPAAPTGEVAPLELRRRVLEALYQLFVKLAARAPLVLEVDDLQWADADSMSLLFRLLHGGPPGLLMVLSLRPAEASQRGEVARFLGAVSALPPEQRAVVISLDPLDDEAALELARETLTSLGLSPDLAPAIATESGGVPFFLEELAHAAAQHGGRVVRLDHALAQRARALPDAERRVVEVLAVANNPIPRAVVCAAAGLEGNVPGVLSALHRGHFVQSAGVRADGRLGIYHDRMRESVLAALTPEHTRALHLALGRALVAALDRDDPGPWLFDTVRHLGAAEPLLVEASERLRAAELHLLAGRQARQAASFALAFRCFEDGLALLPEDAWANAYDTALGLHAGGAEAAHLTGAATVMHARVEAVKSNARSLLDQMSVRAVEVDALATRHDYLAALDAGLEALGLLGVQLPLDPDEGTVGAAFGHTLAELGRIGVDGFSALPDADDPHVLAAMRIQVRLCPVAFFARPNLLALMACNLVTTSVERGLSSATPNALALFGLIMNSAGLYPVSHDWGKLAIELIARFPDRSLEAATRHVAFNFVCSWMVPLRSVLPMSRDVFEVAQRTGDFEYGAFAAHMYTYMAFAAGEPLEPLRDDALRLGEQIRATGQINAAHLHAPFEQLLRALTGAKDEPWTLDDADFDEASILAADVEAGARGSIAIHHVVIGMARYHFGRPRAASEHFERARGYLDAIPSCWMLPLFHQFAVLAGCAAWGDLSADERAALRPSLDASREALRTLAQHAPMNFAHRLTLAEGALMQVDGDAEEALRRFAQALDGARAGAWLGDVALTHELMAGGLRALERDEEADREASRATEAYRRWGAVAKVASA
ncbi:MAG: protein kinase [Sandaracinaceae bacterium]|nr:protein kinase [Sandaracinaceae bacterium]